MLIQEIIITKRDKGTLDKPAIDAYVAAVTDGRASEGQIAAMCMAILLNGMSMRERIDLTMAMAGSGITLHWPGMNGPVLDKHSTGGVGDKVSLMLAPIIAACGGFVPMIAGRGLGHTGGTVDKMEAIPGYAALPGLETLKSVVREAGCAIVGATADIAPADKRIYGIRDVTGTVESIDLITASILSKKLAAGLQGLVMDVKFGTGAFMQDYDKAKALAESIVSVANGAGVRCSALMTDMNQPLGRTAGNAIEVREAVEFLCNKNPDPRLYEVTMALCAELLALGGLAKNPNEGRAMAEGALRDGRAAAVFDRMVAALGGPKDFIATYERHLPLAPVVRAVFPAESGTVQAVDTRMLGIGVIELGGGRRVPGEAIDHGVGFDMLAGLGETVGPGQQPLAVVYGRTPDAVTRAEAIVRKAYTLGRAADGMAHGPVRERVGP